MWRHVVPHTVVTALATAFLALAAPAMAQQKTPKVEVSGGYQLLHFASGVNETFDKGWYADVAGNVAPWLGIVFQVSGSYKTLQETMTEQDVTGTATAELKAHQFMGGARFNARVNERVTPFGEFLVGGFHGSSNVSVSVIQAGQTLFATSTGASSTDVAMQVGGGVNIMLTTSAGIRAGADLIRVFESGEQFNLFRVAAGAIFVF
jgi:opacity protein-like surface antigen